MKKLIPHLWFDNQAMEAATFYTSIFKNSKLGRVMHYTDEVAQVAEKEPGSILTVDFEIDGQHFVALNGGPMFKFSEAISFMIPCEDQTEVDYFWEKLGEGGEIQMCGWLKDKFGVSWQVVPESLDRMMSDLEPEPLRRVMAAFMKMKKLEISELEKAAEG